MDVKKEFDEFFRLYHDFVIKIHNISIIRRDRFTDWAITTTLGTLGVELTLYSLSEYRSLLLIPATISLMLLTSFFTHACIAHAYIKKWDALRRLIEGYYAYREIDVRQIRDCIEDLDYYDRFTEAPGYFLYRQLVYTQFLPLYIIVLGNILLIILADWLEFIEMNWVFDGVILAIGLIYSFCIIMLSYRKYITRTGLKDCILEQSNR